MVRYDGTFPELRAEMGLNEDYQPGDKVKVKSYSSWIPECEIVREATPEDLKKYNAQHLMDYNGKKYLVRYNHNGLFKDNISVVWDRYLEKDDYNESLNEDYTYTKNDWGDPYSY